MAENLAAVGPPDLDGAILRRCDNPSTAPAASRSCTARSRRTGGGQERGLRLGALRRDARGCSTASAGDGAVEDGSLQAATSS
jgi:hypothetical protein